MATTAGAPMTGGGASRTVQSQRPGEPVGPTGTLEDPPAPRDALRARARPGRGLRWRTARKTAGACSPAARGGGGRSAPARHPCRGAAALAAGLRARCSGDPADVTAAAGQGPRPAGRPHPVRQRSAARCTHPGVARVRVPIAARGHRGSLTPCRTPQSAGLRPMKLAAWGRCGHGVASGGRLAHREDQGAQPQPTRSPEREYHPPSVLLQHTQIQYFFLPRHTKTEVPRRQHARIGQCIRGFYPVTPRGATAVADRCARG